MGSRTKATELGAWVSLSAHQGGMGSLDQIVSAPSQEAQTQVRGGNCRRHSSAGWAPGPEQPLSLRRLFTARLPPPHWALGSEGAEFPCWSCVPSCSVIQLGRCKSPGLVLPVLPTSSPGCTVLGRLFLLVWLAVTLGPGHPVLPLPPQPPDSTSRAVRRCTL